MTKQELRKILRSSKSERPMEESEAVFGKIEALPSFRNAKTVLLYWAIPSELPTQAFIEKWYGSKTILLPKVAGEGLELREYRPETMVEGYRGIMEPGDEAGIFDPSQVDLAIIPGLGFDPNCRRLGRGGGFYDRLIPQLECPKVAVSFDCRIVPEVPVEKWDAPVDMVVTSSEIFLPL